MLFSQVVSWGGILRIVPGCTKLDDSGLMAMISAVESWKATAIELISSPCCTLYALQLRTVLVGGLDGTPAPQLASKGGMLTGCPFWSTLLGFKFLLTLSKSSTVTP